MIRLRATINVKISLLLQAFLQRIVNGGGRIEREYGLGHKRTDLLIIWNHGEGQIQKVVLELKIRYAELEKTISEGLVQTWHYMDRAGTTDGHLILFDRNPDRAWADKLFVRSQTYRETVLKVWGM